jgi:hypothetical protein
MRALPKLKDGRPGTGCDDVLDTRQASAKKTSRLAAVADGSRTTASTPTTALATSFMSEA